MNAAALVVHGLLDVDEGGIALLAGQPSAALLLHAAVLAAYAMLGFMPRWYSRAGA